MRQSEHTLTDVHKRDTFEASFTVSLTVKVDPFEPEPENAYQMLAEFIKRQIFVGLVADLGMAQDNFTVEVK